MCRVSADAASGQRRNVLHCQGLVAAFHAFVEKSTSSVP